VNRMAALALAGLLWAVPVAGAFAQTSGSELEACVVAAAGSDDKRVLAQWMFSALALHPDLADMARVSEARRAAANRDMAAMLERFLTVDCAEQAGRAFRAGSAEMAFHRAFVRVGELAGENLFADPAVAAAGQGVIEQFDFERVAGMLAP
jgi:hypothetical protein